MELAIATHTGPLAWQQALDDDPRLLPTALDVLETRARAMRRR